MNGGMRAIPSALASAASLLGRVTAVVALVGVFGSAVQIAAVDIASKLLATSRLQRATDPIGRWLHRSALSDPRFAEAAGEECLLTAENEQECGPLFVHALEANPRLSGAHRGLARLAELRGDVAGASRIYADLRNRDRGFSPQWDEWNFQIRNGMDDQARARSYGILKSAPVSFGGDFALLLYLGLSSRQIVGALLNAGSQERLLRFLEFLNQREAPETSALLVSVLAQRNEARFCQFAAAYIRDKIRRKKDYAAAATVWQSCVERGCVKDRRAHRTDSALLNGNPRLQSPFEIQMFDWSVLRSESGEMAPLSESGGIRIQVEQGAPDSLPLLSKLIGLSAGAQAILIRTAIAEPTQRDDVSRLEWRLYDAADGLLLANQPLRLVTQLEGGWQSESLLAIPSGNRMLNASLVLRRSHAAHGASVIVALQEVRFQSLEIYSRNPAPTRAHDFFDVSVE